MDIKKKRATPSTHNESTRHKTHFSLKERNIEDTVLSIDFFQVENTYCSNKSIDYLQNLGIFYHFQLTVGFFPKMNC